MARYSKGIVDTRKLNKDSKAKLGRRGDTKIREVDNRASHVNALEAYLIDVNGKAGEEYAKRVGAGTVNPLTGMPEYHRKSYTHHHDPYTPDPDPDVIDTYGEGGPDNTTSNTSFTGRQDYETLAGMDTGQLEDYLQSEFDIGEDKMQYIEGFQQKPFDFLTETQALTTGRAGELRGFAEKGLQSAYGATMGALGSQEATLGLKGEGLTAQQTALGRTTGRGYAQATGASAIAASKSGLATSGTITQGLETQKKQLFQDYTAGTQDIGRQRAGIDIAMGDIKRQRGTALEQLTLGKAEAAATKQYAIAGADLDFRTAEYAEKQRQLDELYADVATIPA